MSNKNKVSILLAEKKAYAEGLLSIIENVYDGIFITDGEGKVLMLNQGYERISGLDRRDLVGKNMKELVEKGFLSISVSLMVIEKHHPVTVEQRFMTGKEVVVSGNPIFDSDGNIHRIVTSVRDISEIVALKNRLEDTKLENEAFQQKLRAIESYMANKTNMIVVDEKMKAFVRRLDRVAKTDTTILITGETGTGKNELAKYIHHHSLRAEKSFVTINCSSIPENLVESVLFGYDEGAFTGASKEGKIGLFEVADGGTVFIDEIGELSMAVQTKLLRVLEERCIERVGSAKTVDVDLRIILATNRDLKQMVAKKMFREDLFYRINIYPVEIPPLRERLDDIHPLAEAFLETINRKNNSHLVFSSSAYEKMLDYHWPGNVRELKNMIERAYLNSNGVEVTPGDLSLEKSLSYNDIGTSKIDLKNYIKEVEYKIINRYYETYGSVRKAAQALNMTPSTFNRKKKDYEDEMSQL